jgi:hypothetical protein
MDALSVLDRGYPAFAFATARFAMVYAGEIIGGMPEKSAIAGVSSH